MHFSCAQEAYYEINIRRASIARPRSVRRSHCGGSTRPTQSSRRPHHPRASLAWQRRAKRPHLLQKSETFAMQNRKKLS